MKILGERLRQRARQLELSDSEVARRLGLSQSRYTNYVNGKREPDFATFVRICQTLLIRPDEALGFDELVTPVDVTRLRLRISAASVAMDIAMLETAALVMDALCANSPQQPQTEPL